MRVVNISDTPYEWAWDGGHYVVQPGEVAEFDNIIASHGVNRSERLDELGNRTGVYRLAPVTSIDSARLEKIAQYRCSICDMGLFRKDELKMHMIENHFSDKAGEKPVEQAPRPFRK